MATRAELEARDDVKEILAQVATDQRVSGRDLCPIQTPIGIVVVMNPTTGQWAIARSQIWDDDPAVKSKAIAGLFAALLVYPDGPTLTAAMKRRPAALDGASVMKQFNAFIGLVEAEEGK